MKYQRKIRPFFADKRGEMSHLVNDENKFTSALLITSKKGSIRANHYHKKDTHYSFMLKGSMEYTYKDRNKGTKKKTILVKEGEIIKTSSNVMHAMKFLEDSVMIVLTTEARDHQEYEADTVRIKLI